MRSITPAQAALFAALAMVLLAAFYLADNFALIRNAPALVLLGSVVPTLVWAGFFFAVNRGISVAKPAAWIALVFAVLLDAVVAYVRFQQSIHYWTPFGNALSLSGWLLRLGWAVFLISFALAPDPARDSRTRKIALVLAIVSAPSALSTAYNAWNSWIGLLFDHIPEEAAWRVLITPAIRTIYWLSQVLFLWITWGSPWTPEPAEATSARLAP